MILLFEVFQNNIKSFKFTNISRKVSALTSTSHIEKHFNCESVPIVTSICWGSQLSSLKNHDKINTVVYFYNKF